MMKAIAVNGSPKPKGNTYTLLKTVMDELEAHGIQTQMIQAGGRDIHGCIACGRCRTGDQMQCVFDDDIVNESLRMISEADILLLGSPVYFGGITAQMKAFIDRVGFVGRPHRLLAGKLCASVTAVRRNGALSAFNAMNNLFTIGEGIVVSSSYWNQGIGGAPGEVLSDAEGIETMKTLGRNIAQLAIKLQANK